MSTILCEHCKKVHDKNHFCMEMIHKAAHAANEDQRKMVEEAGKMCCKECISGRFLEIKDNPKCLCLCHQPPKSSWRENIYKTLKEFYQEPHARIQGEIPTVIIDAIDSAYVAGRDINKDILIKLLADSESCATAKEVRHLIKHLLL